jgi:hypothetical protein
MNIFQYILQGIVSVIIVERGLQLERRIYIKISDKKNSEKYLRVDRSTWGAKDITSQGPSSFIVIIIKKVKLSLA